MKSFLVAILCLFGLQNTAQAGWKKVIECNNGDLVVDSGEPDSWGRTQYQLVLRRQPLIHFLRASAIIPNRVNQYGEFIVRVAPDYDDLVGTIDFRPGEEYVYRISQFGRDVQLSAEFGGKRGNVRKITDWKFYNCKLYPNNW